jgi:type VI secretion system protein ImpA
MSAPLAARLVEPVSDEAPCGPDLDMEFDPAYSQIMASSDGMLPGSFFDFKREDFDFAGSIRQVAPLLERSRDLRVLVLLAKLEGFNRNIAGVSEAIAAIAALASTHWDHVHPVGDGGDFGFRIATIEALDDMKHVVLPLQHAPLIQTRKLGLLPFRSVQVASGQTSPREGEQHPDMDAINSAFDDIELEQVRARHGQIKAMETALQGVRATVMERTDMTQSVSFEKLLPAVQAIRQFLDQVIERRDPASASAGDDQPAPEDADGSAGTGVTGRQRVGALPTGPFASNAHVRAALAGVAGYFATREPSSPALLLVAQAHELVGKTFAEALQYLSPNFASEAQISVGAKHVFDLPVERLASYTPSASEDDPDAPTPDPVVVINRREAMQLLQQIATHYRANEPTSPVPLLCERARTLAERDFFSVMREVLPVGAFRYLDEG